MNTTKNHNLNSEFDFKDIYSFLELLRIFNKEYRSKVYFEYHHYKEGKSKIYVKTQAAYEVTFMLGDRNYSGMKKKKSFFNVEYDMYDKLINNKILPHDNNELRHFVEKYLHDNLIKSEINKDFIDSLEDFISIKDYEGYIKKIISHYKAERFYFGLNTSTENVFKLPSGTQDIKVINLTKHKAYGEFKKFISTSTIINVPIKNLSIILEVRYSSNTNEKFDVFLLKINNEKISENYKYGSISLFCDPSQEKLSKLKWTSLPIGEYKIAFNFDKKQDYPCNIEFDFYLVDK